MTIEASPRGDGLTVNETGRPGVMPRAPRLRLRVLVSVCVLVGVFASACASPRSPTAAPPLSVGDDAIVALTGELVRAWNVGSDDVVRVVRERLGARAASEGPGVVVAGADPGSALALVVDLQELPPCRDGGSGVVVGDPARLTGCGARAMAGLAAFLLVVEREPAVAFELVVAGAPRLTSSIVWSAGGGRLGRGGDVDADVDVEAFELEVVDAGVLQLELRRAEGRPDLDGLVVAAGRALVWRSAPRLPSVLRARDQLRRRSLLDNLRPPLDAWLVPSTIDLVVERCRLVAPPTPTAARIRCHVLPGSTPEDVRDAVVVAVDDPRVVVEVSSWVPVTVTSFNTPIARALDTRLASEGITTTPGIAVDVDGSICSGFRRHGGACVGGVPLAIGPTELAAVGSVDEHVDVGELQRLAGRVADTIATLHSASDDRPRATDGAR